MTARTIDAETAHRRLLAIRAHIGNNRVVNTTTMLMAVEMVDEVMGFVGAAARSTEKEQTNAR